MDKSRTFSEVHGERPPGSVMANVFFFQDQIPCDSQGFFLFDHPLMGERGPEGDKRRKSAERKLKKAVAQQAKEAARRPARVENDDDDGDEDEDSGAEGEGEKDELLEPVNLQAWLMGEQRAEYSDISQEIARRYKKRIANLKDAVEFLVKEIPISKGLLAPKFLKLIDKD